MGRWTPLALRKAMETEATAAEAESQGDYEVRCRCNVMAGEYGNANHMCVYVWVI